MKLHYSILSRQFGKPLTREQEYAVGLRIQQGDEKAVEELVTANLAMVMHEAQKRMGHGVSVEDLFQVGAIGMTDAARKFNPALGFKFSTFCYRPVCWRMDRELCEQAHAIRVPSASRAKIANKEAVSAMLANIGRLDSTVHSPKGGTTSFSSFIPAPASDIASGLLQEDLRRSMAILAPRERRILSARFGLDGKEAMTLEEVGAMERLTKERIRQIENAALAALRRAMNGELPEKACA